MNEQQLQALIREVSYLASDAMIYVADHPDDRAGADDLKTVFDKRLGAALAEAYGRPNGSVPRSG
jgi:hypothetical protein